MPTTTTTTRKHVPLFSILVLTASCAAAFTLGRLSIPRETPQSSTQRLADRADDSPALTAASSPPLSPLDDTNADCAPEKFTAHMRRADALGRWQMTKPAEVALNALASDDLGKLVLLLDTLQSPSVRDALRGVLFERWGECDPARALACAETLSPGDARRQAIAGVAEGWAYTDARAAAVWLRDSVASTERVEATLEPIVQFLATEDVAAATGLIACCADGADDGAGAPRWSGAINALANIEPLAALACLRQFAPGQNRDDAIDRIARGYFQSDPASALAWWRGLDDSGLQHRLANDVAGDLAETNVDVALAFIDANGLSLAEGSFVFENVLLSLAHRDPSAALRRVLAIEDAGARRGLLYRAAADLASSAPDAARSFFEALPAGQSRADLAGSIAVGMFDRDSAAAIAWATQLNDRLDRCNAIDSLCNQLAEVDPRAALSLARSLPSGNFRQNSLAAIASRWIAIEPSSALDWIAQLPDGNTKREIVSRVVNELAESDPVAALEISQSMTSAADDGFASAARIARQWAVADPDAAVAWSTHVPDGEMREAFVRGMVAGIVEQRSPEAAAAIVDGQPSGALRDAAAGELVEQWSDKSPADAAAWAAQHISGTGRADAFATAAGAWAGSDPEGAERWLDSLPIDSARDAAISAYVQRMSWNMPATAAAWSLKIDDDAQRKECFEGIMTEWVANEPSEARAWLVQTELALAEDPQRSPTVRE